MQRGPVTADGGLGEPQSARMTWLDLQAHAAFPRAQATVASDVIETPLGRLDCLHYTVEGGSDTVSFWFDTSRPGMPVRVVTERDGHTVESSTMIADERT